MTIYGKGTPIHVRGALLYNFHNKKNKLTHKYPLIQDGEKIKFVYLKTPNKIGENVISYLNTFPKELGLDKQVDYDVQFSKVFLEPIKVIMDTIGWQPEKSRIPGVPIWMNTNELHCNLSERFWFLSKRRKSV